VDPSNGGHLISSHNNLVLLLALQLACGATLHLTTGTCLLCGIAWLQRTERVTDTVPEASSLFHKCHMPVGAPGYVCAGKLKPV